MCCFFFFYSLQDEKIELCRFSKDGTKPFLFCTVQKGIFFIPLYKGYFDPIFFANMDVILYTQEIDQSQLSGIFLHGTKLGSKGFLESLLV